MKRHILALLLALWCGAGGTRILAQTKTIFVTAEASDDGTGTSWQSPMTLQKALEKAVAGDQIWVRGYAQNTAATTYFAPDLNGFRLKSGVKLYGGFAGTETTINDRKQGNSLYEFATPSVISADLGQNDVTSADLLIYPQNTTRSDNARHALVMDLGVAESSTNLNGNNVETLLNGFTIMGGSADGEATATVDTEATGAKNAEHGGGVLVINQTEDNNQKNRTFEISQCFMVDNFGRYGGAVYVDKSITKQGVIKYSAIYNNVAATRTANQNQGGGIWAEGATLIHNSLIFNNENGGVALSDQTKVVNCTVVHNTASAADLTSAELKGKDLVEGNGALYSTVLWGNATLSKTETKPQLFNCAYTEVRSEVNEDMDENANLYISANNFVSGVGDYGAWFVTPTSTMGYDHTFTTGYVNYPNYSFKLEEESHLMNMGDMAGFNYYNEYVLKSNANDAHDLTSGKNNRIQGKPEGDGTAIDIGAYERKDLSGNRRYVAADAADGGDGLTWATAYNDLQTAIDKVAENNERDNGEGEVWVKTGTYSPKTRVGGTDDVYPLSFRMRDGVSVYGGFLGSEESITERQRNYYQVASDNGSASTQGTVRVAWDYIYPTVLQGDSYTSGSATWSAASEQWNVSSKSCHVVWFAPLPTETSNFSHSTLLDGFTIEGGSNTSNSTVSADYMPYKGAGVYINSANALLRNCTVRNNSIDLGVSAGQGGGVYCQNGQVRNCLLYNNSANRGGGFYMENVGFLDNSIVSNNSAVLGGGVYMCKSNAAYPDNYMVLATSVVANNQTTRNAGVYVEGSALVEQNTIVNNYTSNVTDATNKETAYTGGLYLTQYGLIINNIIWNNTLHTSNATTSTRSSSLAQIYAANPNRSQTRFYNNAMSNVNASTWNNIYQSGTVELDNGSPWLAFANPSMLDVGFELVPNKALNERKDQEKNYENFAKVMKQRGVQGAWPYINYYWQACRGSVLRTGGLHYSQLTDNIIFRPPTDLCEQNFEANPPIGAFKPETYGYVFERTALAKGGYKLRLYYNRDQTVKLGDNPDWDEIIDGLQQNGSSWEKAIRSINDALSNINTTLSGGNHFEVKDAGSNSINYYSADPTKDQFEIVCRAGQIVPQTPYNYQTNNNLARTITLPAIATTMPVRIVGGYPDELTMANPTDDDRKPLKYRTTFTGLESSATELSEGLYHIFRMETGGNYQLEGLCIEGGYAAGTAKIPYGGGILIGSVTGASEVATQLSLTDCVLQNNTAYDGAAIAAMDDARNVTVRLTNCLVNNNTSHNEVDDVTGDVIELHDASNTIAFNHVSVVNNIGRAPAADVLGNTSFAAGNVLSQSSQSAVQRSSRGADVQSAARAATEEGIDPHLFGSDGANNTFSLATTGKDGAANFDNPTNEAGAKISGNVYYGGDASFRPLTSSLANNVIINQAPVTSDDADHSIETTDRDLGGEPDLGAFESVLPRSGKVIYVRAYNTIVPDNYDGEQTSEGTPYDCIDGTPNFNLLNDNPSNVYDGRSWGRAIMGNAICNVAKDRVDNDFYVRDRQGKLLAATLDNALYGNDYNATSAPYGQTSNAYSSFFLSGGTSGISNGNKANVWNSTTRRNENQITNDRYEQYVSGLQYAVEMAAKHNRDYPDEDSVVVWVAGGVYTDFKGFVIRNGVKVYGGYCSEGNPGEDDRRPLLSQYVPARKGYEGLKKAEYETILQVRKETPVYLTNSSREIWYSEGKPSDGSNYDYFNKAVNAGKTIRHSVLYQPDVCLPTWGIEGDGLGTSVGANQYRYKGSGSYEDSRYQEYTGVKWDGFTIRHGYIANYVANRDGGAGVRAFRGIRLENLIVVNNATQGRRSRGGGLYLDGDNSVISNSYLLRNIVWGGGDCYGGGAYMIQGVGYNMVVASNRAASPGGGIFIESAKFYNNTVAYNMSNSVQGTGIMHWQDKTTGIASQLTLYNCLVYDNMRNSGVTSGTTQIGSSSVDKFQRSYNCYVNSDMGSLSNKFTTADGNVTGAGIDFPFSIAGYSGTSSDIRFRKARAYNDFRLNEAAGLAGNPCLNGGTENMPNMPDYDMDYTNRIKDCTIDIGAYEADNTENIEPQKRTRKVKVTTTTATGGTTTKEVTETYYVYYVTQNGYGNRSGNSPQNAACADKLQSVLTKAGEKVNELFAENDAYTPVYVKVAGYAPDDNGLRFTYHANTLGNPDDPQSYTFLIPEGVMLMGGYNEGNPNDPTTYNWDNDQRDVLTDYQTILSARALPQSGSNITQEVNGYHVVTFGTYPSYPATNLADYYKHALRGRTNKAGKLLHPRTGIEGVRLVDGKATDNSEFKSMGGGAIVPSYAIVRNCAITDCKALKGGALFLLPGSVVAGSVIHDNEATDGGGIYAACGDTIDGSQQYRAYMASCTIAENHANGLGGGVYQELGALLAGNTVIWGNTATTDNNISGVVDRTFKDMIHTLLSRGAAEGQVTDNQYYPYNNCFVEGYLLPANTQNDRMESELLTYFSNVGEYYPRAYSPLIEQGVSVSYHKLWMLMGVPAYDMLGTVRGEGVTNLTAGAYALYAPNVPAGKLLRRLFVSADGGAEVSAEDRAKYIGRSFYTPFNSLEAAIAYINNVRQTGLASDKDKFEILMTGGTYKPTQARTDSTNSGLVVDRRLQSFVIPVNVSIFGSFHNTDPYSSDPVDPDNTSLVDDTDETFNIIKNGNDTIRLRPNEDILKILEERNNETHMTDINKNQLIEPWEFSRPTIFSGDIKASSNEKHVYHVVCSEIPDPTQSSAQNDNDVLLDGITIMDGQTSDSIHVDDNGNEVRDNIGHGGGIYSRYVSYTLNRCRLLDNKGVHGGAMFIQDASCDIINTLVAGNWAGSEEDKSNIGGHGGAINVYISDDERRGTKDIVNRGNFHAVNSIFANNTAYESSGRGNSETYPALGGALYVRRPLIKYDKTYRDVFITNCLFVSNSVTGQNADSKGTAIYYAGPDDDTPYEVYYRDNVSSSFSNYLPSIYNTVLWNNKLKTNRGVMVSPASLTVASEYDMRYSACDALYLGLLNDDISVDPVLANDPTHHNVLLSSENFTATGPRFTEPTTTAGVDGYKLDARWNPAAISVLTDAGLGTPDATNSGDEMDNAYLAWWKLHDPRLYALNYNDDELNYITYATQSGVTSARGRAAYERYLGPQDVDGTAGVQTIDMGMYEFQYLFNGFSDYSAIYIGTQDHGTGDGSTWDNRSSDLYGAIVAVGNPTGDTSVGTISSDRKIYVEGGEYYSPSYKGYDAFTLSVTNDADKLKTLHSIEIVGALTSASNDPITKKHLGEVRDFSRPTILVPNPAKSRTDNLLNVTTTSRPIRLSGLSFRNHYEGATGGNGLNVLAIRPNGADEIAEGFTGNVTLQNSSFLGNDGHGMVVSDNSTADLLVFNTLYAENGSYGLVTSKQRTTLVNTTFAQNASGDINITDATAVGETLPAVYNSTSWNNAPTAAGYVSALPTIAEQKNVVFAAGQANDDVLAGPCFTDPDTHDYSIRPSFSLMGNADSLLYARYVGAADTLHVDLASNPRFFKGGIDVGAYQCNADQMQIIYVDNRVNDDTGESWAKATNSLQNAVNLAELFANKNKDKYAYVFATKRVNTQQLKVMLPGVRVYGGMEGSESEKRKNAEDEKSEPFTAEQKVDTLLLQRPSILSGSRHTMIANLEMDFDANDANKRSSVVDGIFFTGSTISARRGTIGTSVIEGGTKVTGTADAVLYNSLVDERSSVKDLTEVSNTFVSTAFDGGNESNILTSASGNAANRVVNPNNTEKVNHYVTSDYWRYQLNETELCDPSRDRGDGCINVVDDEGTAMDSTATVAQANIVGHRTDLAGNRRFRDALDYGCFETWYVLRDYKTSLYDYPHGESVVYVEKESSDKDVELRLDSLLFTPRNPFSPGFLLLRHHAGLRSLGATVSLNNFAVERFLKKNQSSLYVMPFTAIARDMYACDNEGNPILSAIDDDSYTSYTYDGLARSQYTFRYGKTEGNAWTRDLSTANHTTTGVRVDSKAQFTIRYYGNLYTENTNAPAMKGMTVTQYNYQEPWASGATDGLRFTYKENMGWNLLGSPYLCAMNYADMSYGRMIYAFSGEDHEYVPINTAGMTSGYIPAFDAWFTQTATLGSYESFSVKCTTERLGSPYEQNTNIDIGFGSDDDLGATPRQRATSATATTVQDVLHLSLAAPTEARAYFDLSADGVKFVDETQTQLFAEREGGRYSMLTALSDETALPVGVNIPKAGNYTFSLPAGNAADEACEAIYLNDLVKGRSVNLKQAPYRFTATEAGELSGRFTLTFRAASLPEGPTDAEGIRITPQPQQQRIEVSGLQEGDVIRLFTTAGQLLTTQRAESEVLYLPTAQRGVHIVEVRRGGRGIKARKVVL